MNNTLRSSPLLSALDDKQLEQLAGQIQKRKLVKKEILFLQNDMVNGFYIVAEGMIKISKFSAEGREHILHLASAPATFAEATLFDTKGFPANAEALEESLLYFVPKAAFLEIIGDSVEVHQLLLDRMSKWIRRLTDIIYSLAFRDVETRIASYLKQRSHDACGKTCNGCKFDLGIEKAVLAAHLGTIPETFSRALKKLQDHEIISIDRSAITILDAEALDQLLEQ
jgi:CRP-like cAMP-binding protein